MEIIEVEENPWANADTDDIAREYNKYLRDIEELKSYGDALKAELANRSLDREGRILETEYGKWKGVWQSGYRSWQRDSLAKEVYQLAKRGELHEPDAEGELPGSVEWRILDGLQKVFRFEPKIGQVKEIGLDPDEYSQETSAGKWSISKIK